MSFYLSQPVNARLSQYPSITHLASASHMAVNEPAVKTTCLAREVSWPLMLLVPPSSGQILTLPMTTKNFMSYIPYPIQPSACCKP